jgi:hypothetical protein
MGRHVRAGDLDIWTEQVGQGPDVLLIGGAGDTVESWQFQLDGLADAWWSGSWPTPACPSTYAPSTQPTNSIEGMHEYRPRQVVKRIPHALGEHL